MTDRRLVTLLGPGGTGKTRLALETAASVLSAFPDGVWFVALGAASTADQVETLTAQVLSIGERGGEELGVTIRRQLGTRELLLVVDNCEHLVNAVAAFVGVLLAACPRCPCARDEPRAAQRARRADRLRRAARR